jgi:hypothetical protein
MNFRTADTFTESLGRLTSEEQTAAKAAAFGVPIAPYRQGRRGHLAGSRLRRRRVEAFVFRKGWQNSDTSRPSAKPLSRWIAAR